MKVLKELEEVNFNRRRLTLKIDISQLSNSQWTKIGEIPKQSTLLGLDTYSSPILNVMIGKNTNNIENLSYNNIYVKLHNDIDLSTISQVSDTEALIIVDYITATD